MYKVYKVVSPDLESACCRYEFPDSYRVKYKIGKFVKPKINGSLLFAFTDLKEAKLFANSLFESRMVYEAEAPSIIKNVSPQKIPYGTYNCLNVFNSFWESFSIAKKAKKKINKVGTPMTFDYKSSVCCPEIKLIKRV